MADLDELVLFDTEYGRYKITRRERRRLAVLHGLPDATAAQLAHGPAPFPGPAAEGFSADYLAGLYDAAGRKTGTGQAKVHGRDAAQVLRAGSGHG